MGRKVFLIGSIAVLFAAGAYAVTFYISSMSISLPPGQAQAKPAFASGVSGTLVAKTDSSITIELSDHSQKTFAISTSTSVFTPARPRRYSITELATIPLGVPVAITIVLSSQGQVVNEIHVASSTAQ